MTLVLDWRPVGFVLSHGRYRAVLSTGENSYCLTVSGRNAWIWRITDGFSAIPVASSDYPHDTAVAAMYAAERAAKRRELL